MTLDRSEGQAGELRYLRMGQGINDGELQYTLLVGTELLNGLPRYASLVSKVHLLKALFRHRRRVFDFDCSWPAALPALMINQAPAGDGRDEHSLGGTLVVVAPCVFPNLDKYLLNEIFSSCRTNLTVGERIHQGPVLIEKGCDRRLITGRDFF
ncbi:MAG: hypothetical protein ACI9F9_002164 [Candidatus Paceibacteria bacterium]|jgi:hypothetical protein